QRPEALVIVLSSGQPDHMVCQPLSAPQKENCENWDHRDGRQRGGGKLRDGSHHGLNPGTMLRKKRLHAKCSRIIPSVVVAHLRGNLARRQTIAQGWEFAQEFACPAE